LHRIAHTKFEQQVPLGLHVDSRTTMIASTGILKRPMISSTIDSGLIYVNDKDACWCEQTARIRVLHSTHLKDLGVIVAHHRHCVGLEHACEVRHLTARPHTCMHTITTGRQLRGGAGVVSVCGVT
jgi:hypothetical protein